MKAAQEQMLFALGNARQFLNASTAELGDVPELARRRLDASITELTEHAEAQDSNRRAARGALARQAKLRDALVRDHMVPITRIARLELHDAPDVIAMTLPKRLPAVATLANLADGLAQAVAPHAKVFIAQGCKADFVQRLRAATAELRNASGAHVEYRSSVVGTTVDLQLKLARARKVVNVLDSFIKSAAGDRAGLYAKWKKAKRISRPRSAAGSTTDGEGVELTITNGGGEATVAPPVATSVAAA